MLKQVATTSDQTFAGTSRAASLAPIPSNKQSELEALTSYFELLSQIDQRLKDEDPEYRERYYPELSVRKEVENAHQ